MRLWTLHPKYLDSKGLVALWREGLLARRVLSGETRGYRNHPQLLRFRAARAPLATMDAYLHVVASEASARGYRFDRTKLGEDSPVPVLAVSRGQVEYERRHMLSKLERRDPARCAPLEAAETPDVSPLFEVRPGPVEPWERT